MSMYVFYIIFKYVYIEQCLEGLFMFVTRLTFTKFARVILNALVCHFDHV